MDLESGQMRAIWRAIVAGVWLLLLLIIQYALVGIAVGRIAVVVLTSELARQRSASGVLFITSGVGFAVTAIFLLLRGNRAMLRNGPGIGTYLAGYVRLTPLWVTVINSVIVAAGIALAVYPYLIGAINVSLVSQNGKRYVIRAAGKSLISAHRYLTLMEAANVVEPAASVLIVSTMSAVFLLADRRGLAQKTSLGTAEG